MAKHSTFAVISLPLLSCGLVSVYFCSYILATITLWLVSVVGLLWNFPCLFFRQPKDSPVQPSAYSMIPNNTSPSKVTFFKMSAVWTDFVGIIYVLELIAMWYLRLQPEWPTLCHGPNATARAAQPYSLKGNQARTRADKSLAMVPYAQPAHLERAAWAAKLEYGPGRRLVA